MSVFEQIVTGKNVADAVESTLKLWMPAYLGEVAAQNGLVRGSLPNFKSFTRSITKLDKFVEKQLPACVIVVPGIVGKPAKEGTGIHRVKWGVGIGMYIAARGQDANVELVQLYCAAVRALLVQKKSLGGFAFNTEWTDEAYDSMKFNDSRTIQAGVVSIEIESRQVVNSNAGPVVVPADPSVEPGESPPIESVFVTTQGQTS